LAVGVAAGLAGQRGGGVGWVLVTVGWWCGRGGARHLAECGCTVWCWWARGMDFLAQGFGGAVRDWERRCWWRH